MNNNKENGTYIIHVQKKTIETETILKIAIIVFMMIFVIISIICIIMNMIQIEKEQKEQEAYREQIIAEQKILQEKERIEREQEEERKTQEKIPKLTDQGRENMASIYKSETKRVFLTFDDGPSTVTSTILDILKEQQIPATFFVLGARVEAMPEITKRIYEEGHYIANHGYSHVYSSIYASPENVLTEFNQCNDAVKNAIGVPEYNSHLFRFPGGYPGGPYTNIKSQAKEILSLNDILYVDWNALTGDAETSKPTVEYEMARIKETVENKNSAVILMHDAQAKKVTAEALPQIISYLKEQGYEFKNFYDIIK